MYFKVIPIILIVSFLSVSIFGQSVVLVGSVTDKVGSEIPAVKITLKNAAGKKYKAMTDNKGEFRVGLAVAIYTVEFRTYGFERLVLKKYAVNNSDDGKIQRLDVRMEVKPSVWTD